MTSFSCFPSPIGPITILAECSVITQIDFSDPPADAIKNDMLPVLQNAYHWLESYFSGERPDPDSLPLLLRGSEFQHSVWNILRKIPYGGTITYGDIAKQLDIRMSAQAVGGAVGRNPISIIIPCHRVLGAGRKLTGYAGGLERKRYLLTMEAINYTE